MMKTNLLPARTRATLAALAAALGLATALPAAAAEQWNLYVYNAVSTVSAVKGLIPRRPRRSRRRPAAR